MLPQNENDVRSELQKHVSYDVSKVSAGHVFATYFALRVMNMRNIEDDIRQAFEDMFAWLDAGNEATIEQMAVIDDMVMRNAEFEGDLIGRWDD